MTETATLPPPPSIPLDPAPEDAVSRVCFSPNSAEVLVSTWASTLTIHSTTTGALRTEAKRHKAALLDAGWRTGTSVTASALDGSILYASFTEAALDKWQTLGSHSSAARVILPSVGPANTILSGGWDANICLWDIRRNSNTAIESINAGGKIFGASACGPNCAILITSQRKVRVLDLRNTSVFLHDRIPPKLAYQLRGISATPDGAQYVVGSTEGRVVVEWLEDNTKSFSFRCHRVDGYAFPVNCVAHNRQYHSFATGGADGHVAFWDGEARKRLAQFSRYPTSIASIDFDNESRRIAIAVSYTFEEGEKDHPPDEVHIRTLDNSHIATKTSKEQHQNEQPQQNHKNEQPS